MWPVAKPALSHPTVKPSLSDMLKQVAEFISSLGLSEFRYLLNKNASKAEFVLEFSPSKYQAQPSLGSESREDKAPGQELQGHRMVLCMSNTVYILPIALVKHLNCEKGKKKQ